MKRSSLIILCLLLSAILLSHIKLESEPQTLPSTIALVKVKVTLPDSTILTLTVKETGTLSITMDEEYYGFSPRITEGVVVMENVFGTPGHKIEKFHFEVEDIVRIPFQEFRQMVQCNEGTCCITCGTTTACACGVEMSCDKCCCGACCAFMM